MEQGNKETGLPKWVLAIIGAVACLLLFVGATLMTVLELDGPQSTLAPDGPVAARQYEIFLITIWVSIGIFVVVGSFMAYCLLRFRHKGEITPDTPLPPQGHGNALLEIGLILVSVVLVAIMVFPTIPGIFYTGTVPAHEDVLVVRVTGYQWWWKFEYPDYGVVTANELAMPAGRPVKFDLRTADVIHSFWVPRLGGKIDMMPNQENWLWLQADPSVARGAIDPETGKERDGIFYGQCAEYCGESHAFMRFRVRVLSSAEFAGWMTEQKADAVPPTTVAEISGNKIFDQMQCGICHTVRGNPAAAGQKGPDLTHVGSRLTIAAGTLDNNIDNLRQWIHDPNSVKPGNLMWEQGYLPKREGLPEEVNNLRMGVMPRLDELSDQDFESLVHYLSSLK
ncbi:MAG: cytochrome c oxidase subunit II [Armatimonadetes bacterium]|nr:cytochrome c oxidase subunit II [Armatimonadota bacterium]